mmetsp:Transcript_39878/g.66819  ORF Transcript_39878/g.66819 Transcript_39878/m.66819 type:complete len:295 (+) Transcript_39878:382-1266(+)|eukprot:jgi/Bigna1/49131/estExt_Genewise1.C_400020
MASSQVAKKHFATHATPRGSANDMVESASIAIKASLRLYNQNKTATQLSSLKAILKFLQKVEKKPSDIRARRLQMSNIVVKKFVTKVKGGLELMIACGFDRENVGEKKEQLIMKEVSRDLVQLGISLVQKKLDDIKSGVVSDPAPAATAMKVRCPCGFWGSSDQEGLCSICYRKKCGGPGTAVSLEVKRTASPAKKLDWKRKLKKASTKLRALHRFFLGVRQESRLIQKNKKRCFQCNKKVGYLGIECRCLFVFCDKHRFPHSHKCKFDYKKLHQCLLKKENKIVKHSKINKIE